MSPIRIEQMSHSTAPPSTSPTPALPAEPEPTVVAVVPVTQERRRWTDLSLTQALGASLAAGLGLLVGLEGGI